MRELLVAILAAGASRRLGQPKQLVKIDGEPLLRRQCRIALETNIGSIAVICGCHADLCIAEISDFPVSIRRNERWEEGISSSIREAARAAIEHQADALLILHVDQYRIAPEDLRTLHAAWLAATNSNIAFRSCNHAYAGPPVIFPAMLFQELLELRGDQGARSVLANLDDQALIEVAMPRAVYDLDLPADLVGATASDRGESAARDGSASM
jgi:molybdenum cofactor cytidylyltransferase